MGRHAKSVRYKKIGKYWYFKLPHMQNFKTTKETVKVMAEQYVANWQKRGGSWCAQNRLFKDYAEPFFDWDRCPHTTRIRAEGKCITKRYCLLLRQTVMKHAMHSPIANKHMLDIRRSDIIDYRNSLLKKGMTAGTVNRIISSIRIIFTEAFYREDILVNPAIGIGTVKSKQREVGIFTPEELQSLFPADYLRIWNSPTDYMCFLLAATTGMRSGEILALRWNNVHFDKSYIHIAEAWKDRGDELGLPKWGKVRNCYIPSTLKEKLLWYQQHVYTNSPDNLVICNIDGSRLGVNWWLNRFKAAIGRAGIRADGRYLKPHSFRHTLNTILRVQGENPDLIRAMLGWSNEAIQDNYTHWQPQHLAKQGEIIDAIWCPVVNSTSPLSPLLTGTM